MAPERTSVPLPAWINAPVPLIALAKSVPCVRVFERLKASAPLLVIALDVERLPVVPPAPIWRVPALMVVAPA